MFWLVANPVVAPMPLFARANETQERLSGRDRSLWRRLESSVATLMVGDRPVGPAALIDPSGLFVAHGGAVVGDTVNAKLGERDYEFRVVARERNSELVLLQAEKYEGSGKPFRPALADAPTGVIFAVLANGPIRADFVPSRRFGVLGSTRRGVPITEIRFEAPQGQFGTGLLLTENGELFGTLNGALARTETADAGSGTSLPITIKLASPVGPPAMTVAYSVGPQFVRRVLEGFLSSDRQVAFPSLGVMCVDAVGGGAAIQMVTSGSPADLAGIKPGDILLDIGGILIQDQLDFARTMLRQEIGRKVPVRLRRGNQIHIRDVVIGRASQ